MVHNQQEHFEEEAPCNHNFAISVVYDDKTIDDRLGNCLSERCEEQVDLHHYCVIPDNDLVRHYHNKEENKHFKITHKVYERKNDTYS